MCICKKPLQKKGGGWGEKQVFENTNVSMRQEGSLEVTVPIQAKLCF